MKRHFLLFLFGLGFAYVLFNSSSTGPGAVQMIDRTGSPLSPGTCATAGCHDTGNFAPELTLELLNNGTPVTQYEPGESYELVATISAGSGSPSKYGLQAVALTGPDDAGTGTFEAPDGMKLTMLNSRTYVEHSTPSDDNTFTIEWTAPASGTGEVRFYAAGIAANGDFNNTGDGTALLDAPLTVTEFTSAAPELRHPDFSAGLFPNPASGMTLLAVESKVSAEAQLMLFDLQGRLYTQNTVLLTPGANQQLIQLDQLTTGIYLVVLQNNRGRTSLQLIKN